MGNSVKGDLFFYTVAKKTVDMDLIRAESEIMLQRADRALQHASKLSYESVSRFLHTREALEHAIQAVAYGLDSAANMVVVCRQELDACVEGQINYNVKEECAKERGDYHG